MTVTCLTAVRASFKMHFMPFLSMLGTQSRNIVHSYISKGRERDGRALMRQVTAGRQQQAPALTYLYTRPLNRQTSRIGPALTVPYYVAKKEIRPNTVQEREDWLYCRRRDWAEHSPVA